MHGTIQMLQKQYPDEPLPDAYLAPTLNGKALEAWDFYQMVHNQWHYVSSMDDTHKTGLNYPTIESIARNRKVKLKGLLFSLLQIIEHKILEKEREEDE